MVVKFLCQVGWAILLRYLAKYQYRSCCEGFFFLRLIFKSVDRVKQITSYKWVGLIKSVEGLRLRKNRPSPNLWEEENPHPNGLQVQLWHQSFACPSLPASPIHYEFSSSYHHTSQFFMMNTSVSSSPSVHMGPLAIQVLKKSAQWYLSLKWTFVGARYCNANL